MRLLSLEVTNYRNIASASLTPGRELTVICGNNGQGKTNLLEAIWLLTGGKSFRGGKDAELVRRGEPFAVLEASTLRAQQEEQEPDEPNRVRLTVGTSGFPAARAVRFGERGSPQAGSRACRQFSGCRVRPRPPESGQGSARGAAQISGCRPLSALPRLPDRVPPLSAGPAAEKRSAAPLPCRAGTSLRRKNGPARGAEHRACRAGGSHPAAAAGLSGTAGSAGLCQLRGAFPWGGADGAAVCRPV